MNSHSSTYHSTFANFPNGWMEILSMNNKLEPNIFENLLDCFSFIICITILHVKFPGGMRLIDPKFLYIIIAASLCCGFVIGYILRGLFRKNARSEEKSESGMQVQAEDLKEKSQNHHYKEIAQLWFDTRDRKLIFQIGEKYFKRADDLSPKDRVKLGKVVSNFYHWLEPDELSKQKESRSSQPKQSGNLESVQIHSNSMTPKDENSPNINSGSANQPRQSSMPDVNPSALFSQSMVSQVDAILQEKIHRAGMEKWAIRLTEFPQRGMVIMVGLEQYESIDEVPYEQARNIIRKSITEWEQRAESGI
jgi:uncharacterized membrane-anchored protein YhcB (DUF1043 family)